MYYKVDGVDESATDDEKYKQINDTYVELVNMGDGKVKVALTKETEGAITTLYKKDTNKKWYLLKRVILTL
ncbi:hypothetical protein SFC43_05995 [Bacteroides sp. CR5/BHMF/2]|nr:hypothetical protein [Bacteroides sp. CR5/BHMF/2]